MIEAQGPIPFARYMDIALYHPGEGYYETERDPVGISGDFLTSVSVGNFFGELLAEQLVRWLRDSQSPVLVEAAAHRGLLAQDILLALRKHHIQFFESIRYVILEPSERQRKLQQERLKEFSEKVAWIERVEALPRQNTIVFSNELFDAFPVRRFVWNALDKHWQEWGVGIAEGQLQPVLLPLSDQEAPGKFPRELLEVLPDGWTLERSTMAEEWCAAVVRQLHTGYLCAIDYGLTFAETFSPAREKGTLRAYEKHTIVPVELNRPGEQDLTAHVHWWRLEEAAKLVGGHIDRLVSQEQFCNHLAVQLHPERWTLPAISQYKRLSHPEHFGRRFQVFVVKKGVS